MFFLLLTQQPGNSETLKPQCSVGISGILISSIPKTNRNRPLKMHGDSKFGISLFQAVYFQVQAVRFREMYIFDLPNSRSHTVDVLLTVSGHQTHRGEWRRNWNKNPRLLGLLQKATRKCDKMFHVNKYIYIYNYIYVIYICIYILCQEPKNVSQVERHFGPYEDNVTKGGEANWGHCASFSSVTSLTKAVCSWRSAKQRKDARKRMHFQLPNLPPSWVFCTYPLVN